MTALALDTADIALYSDIEATRLEIEHLTGMRRARVYERASVRFEGDLHPTEFRGQGRARSYDLTARFSGTMHAEMIALLDLFDLAHESPDSRLALRTHVGQVAGLDEFEVVVVGQVTESPLGGMAWDVTFTAETTMWTLAI